MEEVGMTDLQYKDHLRSLVDDLKEAKEAGVSKEAELKIDKMIKRFEKTLEEYRGRKPGDIPPATG